MLLQIDTNLTSSAVSWMSAGFNIYGAYDIAASTLQRTIFDPAKAPTNPDDTPFGKLPAYLSYRPIKTSDFFYASGDGRDAFQSAFAARASVDVSVGAFSGHVEASYGKQIAESSQYSFTNISFRDMLGNLVLTGLADTKYLSDEFIRALRDLPDTATPENLDQFSDFFQTFGAYFVSQITVGATLEYYVAVNQSTSQTSIDIAAKAEAEYKALFVSGKASAEMSSQQSWQSYRQNKTAVIRIKGGGDAERALLNQVDPKSLDSMSAGTVANYQDWLKSIAANPAVMDFRLTGIWEVCGTKRKAVEDAFRQYGRMMRPLLHIETRTVVMPGDTYTPAVFLGGTLIPVEGPQAPYSWGGYRLVVIDRRHPTASGVRLSRIYNQQSGAPAKYAEVFDAMMRDLQDGRFLDEGYFIVLATYGMLNAFPPVPAVVRALQESGAGAQLASWLALAARGTGTGNITHDINYVLVGITKSGPNAGVELLATSPIGSAPRIPHTSTLDVYFYGLGSGRPFVIGQAERKALVA